MALTSRTAPAKGSTSQPLSEEIVALIRQDYSCLDGSIIRYVHQLPKTICIEESDIADVSELGYGNVEKLTIVKCPNITVVSTFGYIKTLSIASCRSVTDISSLGDGCIEELTLFNCKGIVDVSALARSTTLTTLYLNRCKNIVDVSELGRSPSIKTLYLRGCKGITDVSSLADGEIEHLNLESCTGITNVSSLANGKITYLDLSWCKNIRDVSALLSCKRLQTLILEGCTSVDPPICLKYSLRPINHMLSL